jgi:hypothetical protein
MNRLWLQYRPRYGVGKRATSSQNTSNAFTARTNFSMSTGLRI